jgi:hypothetical protein
MSAGAVVTLTGPSSYPNAGKVPGTHPIWISATIATTHIDHNDDSILMGVPLPDVAYIRNAAGVFVARWTDLDTNAVETLDFDLGFGGSDGVLDYTFINNGTASEDTGVAENSQLTAQDPWISIGGLYVIMEVITAAATPAAGTVQIGFEYTENVIEHAFAA